MASSSNLYVKGLPLDIVESTLKALFGQFGTVTNVKILPALEGMKSVAGFVNMANEEEAQWIIDNVNGNIPQGLQTPVEVVMASPKGKGGKDKGKGNASAVDWSGIPEERRKELTKLLKTLGKVPDALKVDLDPALSAFERKFAHDVAQNEGFESQSYGEGEQRYLQIFKVGSTGPTPIQHYKGTKGKGKKSGGEPDDEADFTAIPLERQKEMKLPALAIAGVSFSATLHCDIALTPYERKFVHGAASHLGLLSQSHGEGASRHLVVTKERGIPAAKQADLQAKVLAFIDGSEGPVIKLDVQLSDCEWQFVKDFCGQHQLLSSTFKLSTSVVDPSSSEEETCTMVLDPNHKFFTTGDSKLELTQIELVETTAPTKWNSLALDRVVHGAVSRLQKLEVVHRPAKRQTLESILSGSTRSQNCRAKLFLFRPVDVLHDLEAKGLVVSEHAMQLLRSLESPSCAAPPVPPSAWPPESATLNYCWRRGVPPGLPSQELANWVCARAAVEVSINKADVAAKLIGPGLMCEDVDDKLKYSEEAGKALPGSNFASVPWQLPKQPRLSIPKYMKDAIVVALPSICKLYATVQKIRQKHDANFESWEPHIKLLYPFVRSAPLDQLWAAAARRHQFRIKLSKLQFFISKNKRILCLVPDDESKAELVALRRSIASALPDYQWGKDDAFFPHLTLAQYSGEETMFAAFREGIAKEIGTEVCFEVEGACMFSSGSAEVKKSRGEKKEVNKFQECGVFCLPKREKNNVKGAGETLKSLDVCSTIADPPGYISDLPD
eukprot:gnl/MRDRNA2_/MRDRNA2_65657_c0_seq1.p1 gnl/MRDRNA2_/MRDRNA2_65657_c0~~gnl/MRDRNA2_/MRDRNA2_65657_c0_seq1.p1  ORF type:complete len:782 (+),score=168.83 gnl/MRDRNA2_/MRDRNA2_65657_c0_seq1:109-2454(+)